MCVLECRWFTQSRNLNRYRGRRQFFEKEVQPHQTIQFIVRVEIAADEKFSKYKVGPQIVKFPGLIGIPIESGSYKDIAVSNKSY